MLTLRNRLINAAINKLYLSAVLVQELQVPHHKHIILNKIIYIINIIRYSDSSSNHHSQMTVKFQGNIIWQFGESANLG